MVKLQRMNGQTAKNCIKLQPVLQLQLQPVPHLESYGCYGRLFSAPHAPASRFLLVIFNYSSSSGSIRLDFFFCVVICAVLTWCVRQGPGARF